MTPLAVSVVFHGTVLALGAVLAVGGTDAPRAPVLTARLTAPAPRIEPAPEPAAEEIVVAPANDEEPLAPASSALFDDPPLVPVPAARPEPPAAPCDMLAADARLPRVRSRREKPVPASAAAAPPAPRAVPVTPAVAPPVPPTVAPAAPPPAAAFSAAVPSADNRAPAYPRIAERRGWTGVVVVAIEVDVTGAVGAVEVLESSGRGVLDDAAVETVRTWRYQPARRGALAVSSRIRQPVRFTR